MTLASFDLFSYLSRSLTQQIEKQRMPLYAHEVAKKAVIILKMSVSLFEESLNSGVSMRVTPLLLRVNAFAS